MSSANWTEFHTRALVKGLVQLCIDGRTTLYHLPDLVDVSNHYGARINTKTLTILRKFVLANGIESDLVGEIVGTGKNGPRKESGKKSQKGDIGKKRKRAKVDEEEVDEEWEDLKPSV